MTNSTVAGFTLSLAATGTPALAYQWLLNGTNLSGATTNSYSQAPATVGQSGSYSCVVTNAYGSVTSAVVSVLITNAVFAPAITVQPVGVTNSTVAGFTLSLTATGTPALAYQWLLNGTNLSGATTNSYSQAPATVGQSGSYSCVVTNAYGSVTSAVVSVLITNAVFAPAITVQPVGVTNSTVAGFTLSLTATGTPALAYQWLLNGTNLSGATTNSYSQVPATVGQSGSYSCVVTNAYGSVTSAVVSVLITNAVYSRPPSRFSRWE